MKPTLLLLISALAQAVFAQPQNPPQPPPRIYTAKATLRGVPGSPVSGVVRLTQVQGGVIPTVLIEAEIIGLKPGAQHGIHIHERGDCSNTNPTTGATGNFLGAGGHFDPGPKSDSNPDNNHPFHMGDLPNIEVNELGVGYLRHVTSRVTLSPGPLTVFDPDDPNTPFDDTDSAFVLHVDPDRGTTGVAGGAGGARLACGIIDRVNGWEEGPPPRPNSNGDSARK